MEPRALHMEVSTLPLSYTSSALELLLYKYFCKINRQKLNKQTIFMETPEVLTVTVHGGLCGLGLPLTLNSVLLSPNLSSSREVVSPSLNCNPSSLAAQGDSVK